MTTTSQRLAALEAWKAAHLQGHVTTGHPATPTGVHGHPHPASPADVLTADEVTAVRLLIQGGGGGVPPPPPPTPTAPGVPTGLTATPGDTLVNLAWAMPGNGGSPITGFVIRRGGTVIATIGVVLTYQDTGRVNGTPYSYTVTAVNAVGEGTQSGSVSATPAAPAPPPPANPPSIVTSLTGVVGDHQVTLSYGPPAVNGGYPITGYRVYLAGALIATVTALSRVVSGLTNGNPYTFSVSAVNSAGLEGPAASTVLTPTGPPPPPPAGTLYGSGIECDSRDNRLIGGPRHDVLAYRFPTNGSAITFVAFDRRFGPDGAGYSLGDGGTYRLAIQAEVSGAPSGVDLGSTTFSPGNVHDHDAQFQRIAVAATPPSGRAFAVLTNIHADPVHNFISANNLCVLEAHADPRQPFGDDNAVWVKNDNHGWREYVNDTGDGVPPPQAYKNTPCVDITFADGHHAGIRYEGVRNALSFYGLIDGSDAIRQTIVPTADVTVTSAAIRLKRLSGSAPLTIEILSSGGSVLASGTVAASFAPISPDLRTVPEPHTVQQNEEHLVGGRWAVITFASLTLTAGQTYYLRVTTTAGTAYQSVAIDYVSSSDTGGSTWGSHAFLEGHAQKFSGSWSDLPTTVVDWQFYLR